MACAVSSPSCRERSREPAGTLAKLRESGVIALGHRESSIPFSYYDDKQQVIGYSHEIMLQVVNAIRKELQLPNLQTKLVPVTSQNRIPLVQNGTVDIECGSTTNNVERQQQVAFSNTIFVISTRFMVGVDATKDIKDFPDLAGKTVVATAGTTSERLLRKMNEEKKMNMQIISAKDHGESFLMLETGRAVAFMNDDVLLFGERAKAKQPERWVVVGTPQSREAYGCMMRKDDLSFKTLVDATIAEFETSGQVARLYEKWFRSPIPPRGLNLMFPMSHEMETLLKNPSDRAID
ncbi:MAG: glutamate/aspartate ABC transporter substrate-binding protein [Myxococcota bacterium]|nr:glutamate/aspartate ABC transporter substrate-binding protein [Myxococcota bacterium]